MTTFLFANVLVSGINIVGDLAAARPAPAVLLCEGLPQTNARSGSEAGGSGQMGRRTRFILAVSLGVSRLQLAPLPVARGAGVQPLPRPVRAFAEGELQRSFKGPL